MPIPVTCAVCGATYTLRDEFAGRRVKCPECQNQIEVPSAPAEVGQTARADDELGGDFPEDLPEEFRRDKFLLRQKLWAIKEKYRVSDADGQPILYVERPVYFMAGCLAAVAGGMIVAASIAGAVFLAGQRDDASLIAGIALGALGSLVGILVIIALYPKRHVQFYTDESKQELLLEVKQDSKFAVINFWYTLTDSEGVVLARFRKNHIHGILRKRWYIHGPEGEMRYVVKEDSIILSLLRRSIGQIADELPLVGLALAAVLRTNFVFTRHGETKVLGEFNRRMTLLDRYVLDLSDDELREIDRRVAIAIGVMLDTGEGR